MYPQGHVLVVGAAGIDYKGLPHQTLQMETSNPGAVRYGFGGVARNIAENLARLEVNVMLLTALGDDPMGDAILKHCQSTGIQMENVRQVPHARTGSYVGIMNPAGDLVVAISDNEILDHLDIAYFDQQTAAFAEARLLIIDLNMSNEALAYVIGLGQKHNLPIVADPTSPVRAGKLRPYLDKLYMITPNSAETTSLCDLQIPAHDLESAVHAAHHLLNLGTKIAIVTLGEQGLAYAESSGTGHIPAVKTSVVDSTGAGDALTAGVIFSLLNDIPLDEAMRLGVTAASLTLQVQESVAPHLTPDLLYDSLVV